MSCGVLPIDRLVFDRSDLSHISTVQEGTPGQYARENVSYSAYSFLPRPSPPPLFYL